MSQAFTIIYEESTPARQNIAYYDAIAVAAGLEITWQPAVRTTDDYTILANGSADALMVTSHDDFQEIVNRQLSVVVSKRGDKRLVALFSSFVNLDTENSEPVALKLSAEFDWQAAMVSRFLAKALPSRQQAYSFEVHTDIATVDERLYSVVKGETDVAVFSMADLNMNDPMVSTLRLMVLPLFECPPSLYQGTTALIVKDESTLSAILSVSADPEAVRQYQYESSMLKFYPGPGSGIVHMDLPLCSFTYYSRSVNGSISSGWKMDAELPAAKRVFSTTDFMKDFFDYEYEQNVLPAEKPVYFVGSHKAVHSIDLINTLKTKRVWAAGTRTWFELAKQGIWVEGSADGLGLETLIGPWSKLFGLNKTDVGIITNSESAKHWEEDGWSVTGTYKLVPAVTNEIISGLKTADVVFWTSFQQYEICRQYLRAGVIHASPAGKTAVLLQKAGVENLIVFPSIKAYSWLAETRQTP